MPATRQQIRGGHSVSGGRLANRWGIITGMLSLRGEKAEITGSDRVSAIIATMLCIVASAMLVMSPVFSSAQARSFSHQFIADFHYEDKQSSAEILTPGLPSQTFLSTWCFFATALISAGLLILFRRFSL